MTARLGDTMLADETAAHPAARLGRPEIEELARQVPEWRLAGEQLRREWRFRDFGEAMAFVNRVADVAQEMDHHPDIEISYDVVRLHLATHKVGGLTQHDFELAKRISRL